METILAQIAGILLAIAAAAYTAMQVIGWFMKYAPRDPQRRFSAAQRQLLMAYAGYRCEHHALLVFRCWATAHLQADHIHPWSRGGRTLIQNGQMLCPRHNRRKTNRIPGPLYWAMIQHRRRTAASSPRPLRSWRSTTAAARTGGRTASRNWKTRSRHRAV